VWIATVEGIAFSDSMKEVIIHGDSNELSFKA
jgi:hypothetical protein